jgi:hypothetical protein
MFKNNPSRLTVYYDGTACTRGYICNGGIYEMSWLLNKIKYFHFKLLIFPVCTQTNRTAASVKPITACTAANSSLYTSSTILGAKYQADIYVHSPAKFVGFWNKMAPNTHKSCVLKFYKHTIDGVKLRHLTLFCA